jgi:Helix-turn-helix domain
MSMRELARLKVIQAVVDGELRAGLAAERLGLCSRQVRRLAQRYRIEGPVGLIFGALGVRPCATLSGSPPC